MIGSCRSDSLSFDKIGMEGIDELDVRLGDRRTSNDRGPAGHDIPSCDVSLDSKKGLRGSFTRWKG